MGVDSSAIKKTELKQNYPNPVREITTIKYTLAKNSDVSLTFHDIAGNKLGTLVNEFQEKGTYKLPLIKPHYHSGIYLYKLTTPDTTIVKKMVLAN